ncbi:MAG: N-acetyltransferase [Methanobrevibacter sp.]|nr:N-acetyltransferase [Methanobrevibacter sp.]
MRLRLENEKDFFEVEKLVRNSFWNIYRPGAFEHYIVHHLRNDKCFMKNLAYIIEDDDKIIGHINYSWGLIDYDDEKIYAAVLGPVSIHENYQNQGFGSKLIDFTLSLTEKEEIPFVFVIGDENYYHRFGFESASKYGLFLEGTNTAEKCPFFMIKVFDKNKLKNKVGIFHNPEVFNVNQRDVDEFDKKFEFREKLVLDTQLEEL